jgi:hypothetical protein
MAVKLNLLVNEETARRIKLYAAKNNTSVSKIAEEQFNKLTVKPAKRDKSFSEKYAGTLSGQMVDIEAARDEYLKEKYGL